MGPPVIDYSGTYHLDRPPRAVWGEIERFDRYERWWPWFSGLRVEGEGLQPGVVLHGVVCPPVPYRMRIDVELGRCTRFPLVEAAVHGDLEGPAHLRLTAEGSGTCVEVGWSVEMRQVAMRLACRVARPLLIWGHDRVVAWTVAGFSGHLEADLPRRGRVR